MLRIQLVPGNGQRTLVLYLYRLTNLFYFEANFQIKKNTNVNCVCNRFTRVVHYNLCVWMCIVHVCVWNRIFFLLNFSLDSL